MSFLGDRGGDAGGCTYRSLPFLEGRAWAARGEPRCRREGDPRASGLGGGGLLGRCWWEGQVQPGFWGGTKGWSDRGDSLRSCLASRARRSSLALLRASSSSLYTLARLSRSSGATYGFHGFRRGPRALFRLSCSCFPLRLPRYVRLCGSARGAGTTKALVRPGCGLAGGGRGGAAANLSKLPGRSCRRGRGCTRGGTCGGAQRALVLGSWGFTGANLGCGGWG